MSVWDKLDVAVTLHLIWVGVIFLGVLLEETFDGRPK